MAEMALKTLKTWMKYSYYKQTRPLAKTKLGTTECQQTTATISAKFGRSLFRPALPLTEPLTQDFIPRQQLQ